MPREELIRLGLVAKDARVAAFPCFLTTDQHKNEAFDQARRESAKTAVHVEDELGVMAFMRAIIYKTYRSIDIKLMQLQRRETLWTALIMSCRLDDSKKSQLISALGTEIDGEFERLWLSRPID